MLGALVVYLLYALCGKIYNTLCGECWLSERFRKVCASSHGEVRRVRNCSKQKNKQTKWC